MMATDAQVFAALDKWDPAWRDFPAYDPLRSEWISDMRAALEAAEAVWEPTHRHIKSGGFYRVLHKGFMEADLSPVVIYTDIVGHVWVRPAAKFDDGRFEPLPAPPKETE